MIAEQSRYPINYTQMNVYIQNRQDHDFQGVLSHRASGLGWRFHSLLQLMQIYETFCNNINYPQPTHRLRAMNEDILESKEMKDLKNIALEEREVPCEKPTFIVKVQYRQNASWQVSIEWVEGGLEKKFRSTLELIKLMDDAISDQESIGWK